jgi:A1 cistron-splicing factor AAR2
MDAESVQGATVLLLNLPQSALGGVDLLSFTTTARFKGIKHLPPGLHFVFASATTSLSIRHGAWFRVQDNQTQHRRLQAIQLFVKKWNPAKEELFTETDEAEVLRQRQNLAAIWREGLTPYRQSTGTKEGTEEKSDWPELTSYISDALLSRVTGDAVNSWCLTSASSAQRDLDDIPGLDSGFLRDKNLTFLPIELKNTWRPGATGRERTEGARDHSWALGELIDGHCNGDVWAVLGEMQLCFMMVLTLNNFSCLEQWKRLLMLLFTCQRAVKERPALFVAAVKLLRLQLMHSQDGDGGLFDMSDEGAGFLKRLLRRFRKSLADIEGLGGGEVMDELDELGAYLHETHGWDLEDNVMRSGLVTLDDGERVEVTMSGYEEEDESGEYAPMVVELSQDQLKEFGAPPSAPTEHVDASEEDEDPEDMDQRY